MVLLFNFLLLLIDSSDSYSSSSISTVGLKTCETQEMSLDSLIKQNEFDDTLSSDLQAFTKDSTNQKVSKKIQTFPSILVDSAVQTESRVAHTNFQKNITHSDDLHSLLGSLLCWYFLFCLEQITFVPLSLYRALIPYCYFYSDSWYYLS